MDKFTLIIIREDFYIIGIIYIPVFKHKIIIIANQKNSSPLWRRENHLNIIISWQPGKLNVRKRNSRFTFFLRSIGKELIEDALLISVPYPSREIRSGIGIEGKK